VWEREVGRERSVELALILLVELTFIRVKKAAQKDFLRAGHFSKAISGQF
jgi:hypothetical protein